MDTHDSVVRVPQTGLLTELAGPHAAWVTRTVRLVLQAVPITTEMSQRLLNGTMGQSGSLDFPTGLIPPTNHFGPIDCTSVQLQSKTGHSYAGFCHPSQVRPIESSEVMERAMGIEPTSGLS